MKSCDDWLVEAFQARNLDLPEMAAEAFRQALSIEPDDPAILMELARCHFETGEIGSGRQVAGRIRGIKDDEGEFWLELGKVWMTGGDPQQALSCFRKVLPSAPEFASCRVEIALLAERTDGLHESTVSGIPADCDEANLIEGILASSRGDQPGAIESFRRAVRDGMGSSIRVEAGYRLARLLLRTGEPAAAIEILKNCKFAERRLLALARLENQLHHRRQYDRELLAALPDDWFTGRVEPAQARSLMLLGHPRSGTSLLAKQLATGSGLTWVDEPPVFDVLARQWVRNRKEAAHPEGLLRLLTEIGPETRRKFTRDYFDRLAAYAGAATDRRFLDKNPGLGTSHHALHRLLPETAWIFCLRHPLAIALSCYSQRFGPTLLGAACLTWEGTLAAVRHTLGTWINVSTKLPKHSVAVARYEDLVSDPVAELDRLRGILGCATGSESDGEVVQVGPLVNQTPSHADLRRPIYRDSARGWTAGVASLGRPTDGPWKVLEQSLGYPE